jgi:DNA polymerase elongation subunit (family B)
MKHQGPKVLLLDIETSPIIAHVWKIWDENIALNQIKSDWHILSWAAKWLHDPPNKIMYQDNSNSKNLEDDSKLLKAVWKLLDEADIVITQNGKNFDHKKLNARFIISGFKPPSSFKYIDTFLLAKKHFGFTSNKLEYMSDKICKKYKKLKHAKFSGFEMWRECLAGNKAAWAEMKKYNKYDVLALEELYNKMMPWDNSINFNLYTDSTEITCKCGSKDIFKNGTFYTNTGRYQRYTCKSCGSETRGRKNLLSKAKNKSIRVGTTR